ncbi:c-type cytochrome [Denitromonas sp.]|uniref:c-type cytochrome n=1 Tax=Denitromonas sp. TaxID=2734609 RepID=UPI003A857B54
MSRARPRHARRLTAIGLLIASALMAPAHATLPLPPDVDSSALRPIVDPEGETNPYRDEPRAIAVGRAAFNQSCAACHGIDADASRSPAPDLRRIGRSCGRVPEPDLKRRCQTDADVYFRSTVEKGKIKLGIEHMPPWKGILSTELIWAIRSFVETSQGRAK